MFEDVNISEEYIIVSGRKIRLLRQGSGPPLILLHGLGASADWWLPNFPAFSSKFSTIAVDIPGHGFSDDFNLSELNTPETFLLSLFKTLKIKSASIVGNSMGGYIAARFVLNYPDLVNHLILVDSAGFGNINLFMMRMLCMPFIGEILCGITIRVPEISIRSVFYDKGKIPHSLIMKTKEYIKRPGFSNSQLRILRSAISPTGKWKREILTEPLKNSSIPLLVIWGAQDPLLPVKQAESIRNNLPNASVYIFDKCGHVPQIEYPSEFTALVLSFLAKTNS